MRSGSAYKTSGRRRSVSSAEAARSAETTNRSTRAAAMTDSDECALTASRALTPPGASALSALDARYLTSRRTVLVEPAMAVRVGVAESARPAVEVGIAVLVGIGVADAVCVADGVAVAV